ncbi:hypothetical protein A3D69_03345 [Candidatus Uhrbacteria bacterium RIFCSPHIGHO2_02_FULL_54_11]|nr:MAG: hypothetical protein A3D69_03345 [Candidatus Uhrbacteria bacterium RIFCSPHIGHO2_02_FULL_54_11]
MHGLSGAVHKRRRFDEDQSLRRPFDNPPVPNGYVRAGLEMTNGDLRSQLFLLRKTCPTATRKFVHNQKSRVVPRALVRFPEVAEPDDKRRASSRLGRV